MNKDLIKFGVDWLNGVLPCSDALEVFKALETFSSKLRLDRWSLQASGMYNYKTRFMLDGKPFVQLAFNPVVEGSFEVSSTTNNPGIFFSISGDGLRYLSSLGGEQTALNKLLFYFYRNGFKASRFDVYCDILDKKNKVVPLIQKSFRYFLQPRVGYPTLTTNITRQRKNVKLYRVEGDNGVYYNCSLGSRGSDQTLFRCYNKYDEVKDGRLSDKSDQIFEDYKVTDYWYRLEYEIHKRHASEYFNAVMEQAEKNNQLITFVDCFLSAFDRTFTPVIFDAVSKSRICALPVSPSWSTFRDQIASCPQLFISSNSIPYVPMSKSRLHSYIKKNSAFVFNMLTAMLFDRDFGLSVISEGADKYRKNNRYNEIRDELHIDKDFSHQTALFQAFSSLCEQFAS